MANILLTGGRAPATLDLARSFHAQGHRLFVAESLAGSLTATSNATYASFVVPPPRQQPAAFVESLAEIIQTQRIDLLIPTCEEIFYVAMGREKLAALCTVFVEPIERLRLLHDKWTFIQTALEMGLSVPGTLRIETEADLCAAFARWPRLVLKPVYSRFASRTLILPPPFTAFASLRASPASPWVAQEYLAGEPICTYSVAHAGRLTAHTAYRAEFTAGQGATIRFQHAEHPASLAWVQRFVEAFGFTGQIAFDFIEEPGAGGTVRAIECNPRATSGVHLLAAAPRFPDAFFQPAFTPVRNQNRNADFTEGADFADYISVNPPFPRHPRSIPPSEPPCLFPPAQAAPMLLSAMLLYGLPAALKKQSLSHWWQAFRSGRDVIFRREDARPAFAQWHSLLHFVALGWRHKITPLEASTRDIEWNGEV